MAGSTKHVQYRYDSVGNRIGMTDPDGGRFTYAYDNVRRITHLENPQNERTSYVYDAKGRRTVKKLANGTRASFAYDAANNLTRLANLKSDGTTISSFGYEYDNTGNRTSVLEADGSRVTWSYDKTYQLTGEHRTGSNAYRNTFAYDPAANRTLKDESGQRTTYAYDAANQLETSQDSLGTTTYTFDANGNQQIVQPPTDNRTTTVWDYENRTVLIDLPSGLRNTMAYDPDGLRIKLEESTGTKKFIWDDQNYLAETDASDVTQVVYTNEPAIYGNLISQRRATTSNWYHFDAIGSTRELTLAAEAVSDAYLYDAWGSLFNSTGASTNPFQFVGNLGYYFDTDYSHIYIRGRIYLPLLARWTSRDAKMALARMNLYGFVSNEPSHLVDPSGFAQSPTSNQSSNEPEKLCKIRVCATPIEKAPGAKHLLTIVDGVAYRCGPSGKGREKEGCTCETTFGDLGQLVCTKGKYEEGFVDWLPPDKENCEEFEVPNASCETIGKCFSKVNDRIDSCCINYVAAPIVGKKGCNSNCAVKWMLSVCFEKAPNVILAEKPGIAPGYQVPPPDCVKDDAP